MGELRATHPTREQGDGAPARVGSEVMGSLAVIGPTRMDYEHTINAVSYIARLFDKILNNER